MYNMETEKRAREEQALFWYDRAQHLQEMLDISRNLQDFWQEQASKYAGATDYWREIAEDRAAEIARLMEAQNDTRG